MAEEFIREIKEHLKRHMFISGEDVERLIRIIDMLNEENIYKSKYIKELEELNKTTTKSFFIYADGDVILNANNDND